MFTFYICFYQRHEKAVRTKFGITNPKLSALLAPMLTSSFALLIYPPAETREKTYIHGPIVLAIPPYTKLPHRLHYICASHRKLNGFGPIPQKQAIKSSQHFPNPSLSLPANLLKHHLHLPTSSNFSLATKMKKFPQNKAQYSSYGSLLSFTRAFIRSGSGSKY